jgi:hypothetical protein
MDAEPRSELHQGVQTSILRLLHSLLSETQECLPPSRNRRDAHQACCLAILMILGCVYSSRPAWPSSAPMPDCLSPLKGMSGCSLRCLLIQTVPELICEATAKARSRRPDAAAQPELRIVRARDGVCDLGVAQHRQNWAELLFLDQSRIVADVANNRRFDEIALALQNIAARNNNTVLFGTLQEALHSLEMRLILQRPYLGFRLGAVIDDSLASQPPEFLAEFVVLRIMNVEALDHDATLAGIEGRAGEQLGRYLLWIDIVEHNGGVIASDFQHAAIVDVVAGERQLVYDRSAHPRSHGGTAEGLSWQSVRA